MTFDWFEPGMEIGRTTIDAAPLIADWRALFPANSRGDSMPAGLLVAILMRGYTTILDRRPPGNIHAAQTMRWGAPADPAAPLTVILACRHKERRGEQPWLTFDGRVTGANDESHLEAEMRFLWAG